MKKITTIFSVLLASILLFSCANSLDEIGGNTSGRSVDPLAALSRTATVNFNVLYADSTVDWNVWAWAKADKDVDYATAAWPGDLKMTKSDDGKIFSYSLLVDPNYDLGCLFVSGSNQTKDCIIPKAKLVDNVNFYFIYGDTTIYSSKAECTGLKNASITATNGNTVLLNVYGMSSATTNSFTVKDSDGKALTISAINATDKTATLTLSDGNIEKRPYSVTDGTTTVVANITSELIDELELKYDGDDLGVTLNGTSATFKVWSPSASTINLLLYSSADDIGNFKAATVAAKSIGGTDEVELKGSPAKTEAMTIDSATGVWSKTISDVSSYKFYKYEITLDGNTYYVCDINAKVCSADSIAAQIASIDDTAAQPASWETSYKNPFGTDGTETKKYNDAVIYEMHIRDWSRAAVTDSTGKFLDVVNSTTIMNHLKDLGVTHVQILPMFDYAQVNANGNYNWGYNPYHYNVPEGRYVTSGYTDGLQAVKEMRTMIQKFHDAGIAVIMDVVYNHTNGTQTGSLYDSTVPQYFYRLDDAGNYINGSGCGNEIATNHTMVKKYVIDSLKHWMNDYHINGFRFDLMGCQEQSTMKEIYEALYEIDNNVLVYGEPWTGGTSGVKESATGSVKTSGSGYGVGAFDDDFRDAVKGAEFGGFKVGQVQASNSDKGIVKGLIGEPGSNNRNSTGISGLSLHYVECHDNFTLYDKLVYSLKLTDAETAAKNDTIAKIWPASITEDEKKSIIKQDKLAASYILLAQGTPFINGGQEFLRTKKGNPDSYSADTKGGVKWTNTGDSGDSTATNIDAVNTIDLGFKSTYSDVYNTYKALINLRKSSNAFTDGGNSTAKTIAEGVTLYNAKSSTEEYEVIFNAKDSEYVLTDSAISGKLGLGVNDLAVTFGRKGKVVTIDETTGNFSIADTITTVTSVPAKSIVILKK